MKNSKSPVKVIAGIIIGAVTGAALGVLFAPNKGVKTRSKIAGNTEGMLKELKKRVKFEAKKLESKALKTEKEVQNATMQIYDDHIDGKFDLIKDGINSKAEVVK